VAAMMMIRTSALMILSAGHPTSLLARLVKNRSGMRRSGNSPVMPLSVYPETKGAQMILEPANVVPDAEGRKNFLLNDGITLIIGIFCGQQLGASS